MAEISGYMHKHTNPPVFVISAVLILAFVTWGVAAPDHLGSVAGEVAAGDALSALQTASVTSGLPFSVVLAFMCWGLVRQLRQEPAESIHVLPRPEAAREARPAE